MISIDRLKEMALEDIENNPEKHLEEYTELLQQLDQLKDAKEQAEQKLEKIREYCNKYPQNSIGFKKSILQIIDEVENAR